MDRMVNNMMFYLYSSGDWRKGTGKQIQNNCRETDCDGQADTAMTELGGQGATSGGDVELRLEG